jgi:serine/threonine-protein kinase
VPRLNAAVSSRLIADQRSFDFSDGPVQVRILPMQTQPLGPLAQLASFRGVTEHHEPVDPSGAPFKPRQLVDNRFLITEVLNRSGMATLFKAEDRQNGNQAVAVKVPHLQYESDPTFYSRFQREERIGLELNHPFILRFIRVEGKSRPYLVTEYLRGSTLERLLRRTRPLPETDAVKLASLICEALQYLHAHNVIHRDLKPQNVMICCDGTIRLMDFGIARDFASRRITRLWNSTPMGTPDYMAPEQVEGKQADSRTDIYNLGALLYELVTGAVPFPNENPWAALRARVTGDPVAPRELNPGLSAQVEEVVLRTLQRNPADRYPTVVAMKGALDNLAQVQVTGLADRLQQPRPWKRRWFRLPWPLALALLGPHLG